MQHTVIQSVVGLFSFHTTNKLHHRFSLSPLICSITYQLFLCLRTVSLCSPLIFPPVVGLELFLHCKLPFFSLSCFSFMSVCLFFLYTWILHGLKVRIQVPQTAVVSILMLVTPAKWWWGFSSPEIRIIIICCSRNSINTSTSSCKQNSLLPLS